MISGEKVCIVSAHFTDFDYYERVISLFTPALGTRYIKTICFTPDVAACIRNCRRRNGAREEKKIIDIKNMVTFYDTKRYRSQNMTLVKTNCS